MWLVELKLFQNLNKRFLNIKTLQTIAQKLGLTPHIVNELRKAFKQRLEDFITILEKFKLDELQKLNAAVGLNNLKNVLNIWENNQNNSNEEFWHNLLSENTFVFAQIFSFPVVVIKDKAYVGGKGINNKGGNIIDFLCSNDLSGNVALVEIKTPQTKLLGTQYRSDIYNVSSDLSGSVIQIENHKNSLIQNYKMLIDSSNDPEPIAIGSSL